jgi:hypothetical protein
LGSAPGVGRYVLRVATTWFEHGAAVAGYRLTSKVVINRMTVRGDAVSVRALAYEPTGAVQTYQLNYVVSGPVIVIGQSRLLSTSG